MKLRFSASLWILALLLLAGCGGGGSEVSSVTYTGSTSPAAIADNNAEAVAIDAYQAGARSSFLTGPMSTSPSPAAAAGSPRTVTLVRTLQSLAGRISPKALASTQGRAELAPREMVQINEFFDDGLGGSASLSISGDNVTGEFTGSFTFQNFHANAETVISGGAVISGLIDLATEEMAEITFTFVALTLTDPAGSITISGDVALVASTPSSSATLDLMFRDNATGKTVWINNYSLVVTNGPDLSPADGTPDYVDVDISGRIYLHDYGYVDVTTTVPMRIYADSMNPSVGTIVMTGSGGRSVRMIVIDELSGFDLEADLNSDGTYEWSSPDHPWA